MDGENGPKVGNGNATRGVAHFLASSRSKLCTSLTRYNKF